MTTKKPPAKKKAGGEAVPEKKTTGKRFVVGDGTPGPGRPKGMQNKVTKQLKEMVLGALDQAGGEQYLLSQARDNPGPFMTLLGKILPTQLTGKDGEAIKVEDATVLSVEERKARAMTLAAAIGARLDWPA